MPIRDCCTRLHDVAPSTNPTTCNYCVTSITADPTWPEAISRGIMTITLAEDWTGRPSQSHIIPIWTRNHNSMYFACQLIFAGSPSFFAEYPIVRKGRSRV
ncbi:hypothetical protein BDV95DRAFT_558445 [Massariosphaeria phaeospora]|uniref:Uncharacterized protein n=1 Tax=Massariosphaeria phaeospora TaxID=100035 RepID=A0A7C8MU89_9PLEO|nr:hypothetical protein BDV95DRAFT_558445 [Massariosphaeria phaeospora]